MWAFKNVLLTRVGLPIAVDPVPIFVGTVPLLLPFPARRDELLFSDCDLHPSQRRPERFDVAVQPLTGRRHCEFGTGRTTDPAG